MCVCLGVCVVAPATGCVADGAGPSRLAKRATCINSRLSHDDEKTELFLERFFTISRRVIVQLRLVYLPTQQNCDAIAVSRVVFARTLWCSLFYSCFFLFGRLTMLSHPNHPLLKDFPQVHLLPQTPQVNILHTIIRDKTASREDFVFNADRLIRLIVEEGLSFLPATRKVVETLTGAPYEGLTPGAHICGVSIVRAGESMEQALRETCRAVRIGKILIQRNEHSADKVPDTRYSYSKMPNDIADRWVFLMDPMLATGGSAIKAVDILVEEYKVKPERIVFLNVVSSPEGIRSFCSRFPSTRIITSAIDAGLNDHKYIVPGLGDFGDRYFGTDK